MDVDGERWIEERKRKRKGQNESEERERESEERERERVRREKEREKDTDRQSERETERERELEREREKQRILDIRFTLHILSTSSYQADNKMNSHPTKKPFYNLIISIILVYKVNWKLEILRNKKILRLLFPQEVHVFPHTTSWLRSERYKEHLWLC